ncbi:MAG: YciI family protein [Planctomycetota bacterium]
MNQYLLSVHTAPGADCHAMPPEEMQKSFQRIEALESEMKEGGAWMFSGRLTEPESATVVRDSEGKVLMTDGPFIESKEHLGGFYIIQAPDLDAALAWASKVTSCVGQPIEVRPFWSPEGA